MTSLYCRPLAGGSPLEAMALAVEDASVVLIAASTKYKDSANCRTGEYIHCGNVMFTVRVCLCECACVRVCVRVRACVRACACVCACVNTHTHMRTHMHAYNSS